MDWFICFKYLYIIRIVCKWKITPKNTPKKFKITKKTISISLIETYLVANNIKRCKITLKYPKYSNLINAKQVVDYVEVHAKFYERATWQDTMYSWPFQSLENTIEKKSLKLAFQSADLIRQLILNEKSTLLITCPTNFPFS